MARGYNWKFDIPPEIDEHSIAKHRVLRRYVENYIQILCLNPRRECLRLVVVDGFCGGGLYQTSSGEPHLGSPLILRQALQAGRAFVQTRRVEMGMHRPFDLEATLHLNDNDADAIKSLRAQLATCPKNEWAPTTHVTQLDFNMAAAQLITAYKHSRRSPRIIFVLDQYGFTQTTLPVMKSIFTTFPKAEIVLTFAVDALTNFASPETRELYRRILAKTGFDEVVSAERLTELKAEDHGAKHVIQTLLLREVFPQTGAAYATPFFVIPRQSRRGYWLVHLANNTRANDEMKRLHWQEHNHFMHFGAEGVGILAFDPVRLDETPQYTFDFGDIAQQRTSSALHHDLPKLVHDQFSAGTNVGTLLERIANETPATRDMVQQVLFELGRTGEIEMRTQHGRQRKHVDRLQLLDEIHPRRQFFLFR
ncbi:three-Cys-motif partner protein TcmP [Marilutibacter alkalisoli]|nr:three-Cys-motif partner protein TcmP [Lysobacter alkalisoli]